MSLATEKLASGSMDSSLIPKRDMLNREDELGILARSFEKLIRSLQAKDDDLQAHTEELVAQQGELTEQRNKLLRSLEEVEKHRHTLLNINRLNHDLSVTLDQKELLQSVLIHVLKIYRMDKAIVFLLDSDMEYASIGIPTQQAEAFKSQVMDSLVIRLVETREPFLVKRKAEGYEQGYHDGEADSQDLYLPIFNSQRQLISVLIATRLGVSFHEDEVKELMGVMKRISLSLERISLYKQSENNRQLNQDILENVNEGIQLVDIEGRLIQHNPKWIDMIEVAQTTRGITNSSFKEWTSQFPIKEDHKQDFLTFMQEAVYGQTRSSSYQYDLHTSSTRIVDVYAQAIYRHGQKIGTLFVHRDITKEYEVDRMKSDLVSTVSHELRTPLTNVLGFAELLLTRNLKPERQQKYLDTIYKEAARLTNLINDFLDLQRIESGKQSYHIVPLDINSLLRELLDTFRIAYPHHAFQMEANEAQAWIAADQEKMIQVYTNLLSNAVKFSPEGGEITVTVEATAEKVWIHVSDQGLGIPEEELPRLFQKFHRIKTDDRQKIGGTGLGLAICKEIIMAHDGNITVQSQLGRGATFSTQLPLAFIRQEGEGNLTRVYVVEDDQSLALLLTEELTECGFNVTHYTSGTMALSAIERNPPSAIVLDLMLSDPVDGWKVIEELKRNPQTSQIPILISSAFDEKEKGISIGASYYLTKPYPPGRLCSALKEVLGTEQRGGDILVPDHSSVFD